MWCGVIQRGSEGGGGSGGRCRLWVHRFHTWVVIFEHGQSFRMWAVVTWWWWQSAVASLSISLPCR